MRQQPLTATLSPIASRRQHAGRDRQRRRRPRLDPRDSSDRLDESREHPPPKLHHQNASLAVPALFDDAPAAGARQAGRSRAARTTRARAAEHRGATNSAIRSTSPARSQAVPSAAPPSSSTSWQPSRASRRASARGETPPRAAGSLHTRTPRPLERARAPRERRGRRRPPCPRRARARRAGARAAARAACRTPPAAAVRAARGVAHRQPRIVGARGAGADHASRRSARAAVRPARASGPVIQRERPRRRRCGRRAWPRSSTSRAAARACARASSRRARARARSAQSPTAHLDPRAAQRAHAPPFTIGCGSRSAITQRRIPRGDQRVGARRRAARVRARLERHVERRAARPRSGARERLDSGVRAPERCGASPRRPRARPARPPRPRSGSGSCARARARRGAARAACRLVLDLVPDEPSFATAKRKPRGRRHHGAEGTARRARRSARPPPLPSRLYGRPRNLTGSTGGRLIRIGPTMVRAPATPLAGSTAGGDFSPRPEGDASDGE